MKETAVKEGMLTDMKLFENVNKLLDNAQYDLARAEVRGALAKESGLEGEDKIISQMTKYGLLMDVGIESRNKQDLDDCYDFLISNKDLLCVGERKASYFYNLANVCDGLANVNYSPDPGKHQFDTLKELFQNSIQYYWTALKSVEEDDDFRIKILTNLSNSLFTVGRMVEAIQFHDEILRIQPGFPQALFGRGEHLNRMKEVTNSALSTALHAQIVENLVSGISTSVLPSPVRDRAEKQIFDNVAAMAAQGYTVEGMKKEVAAVKTEYLQHSIFRRFCIDNHLTLNEHGIYCGCESNSVDDLQIGVKHGFFRAEVVAKMELLLNRLKSEFAFARWSYFNSDNSSASLEFGVAYSDLLENEIITPEMELKRTAFRICYGILDKIALGICKLLNIPTTRIHFEHFWEKPNIKAHFFNLNDMHLNALYSIACDLNTTTGELKHFKNWRNKLEHNLLVVKDTMNYGEDVLGVFSDANFVAVVDEKEFEKSCLHLLQLTRAAIFSFVYSVRFHTIERPNEANEGIGISVSFK